MSNFIKKIFSFFSTKEIKEELSRINERLNSIEKLLTEPKQHRKRKMPLKSKRRGDSEQNVITDLHGNPVPVKQTMDVRTNSSAATRNVRKCKVWGCDKRTIAEGYCQKHYERYSSKAPTPTESTPEDNQSN